VIVLADNDILFKLAQCDLFGEFLDAFAISASDVRILKSARYSSTSSRHRKRIGEASFGRLTTFLATIADIPIEPDPDFLAALTEQTDKNIDAGEAALFGVCPLIADSVIVTGDKKSLIGLIAAGAEETVCGKLCECLDGRIICFEMVLLRILDVAGFDPIRDRLIRGRECDGGLKLWIGSGLDISESVIREGISSYMNDLRGKTDRLLAR
jgi:hypothetical protein